MGLLKNTDGHLVKNASGKLALYNATALEECCCTPGCDCVTWPPSAPVSDWPCWPCGAMHQNYTVAFTLNWEQYSAVDCVTLVASGSCSVSDITVYAHASTACRWETPSAKNITCGGGFCINQIATVTLWWDDTAELWYLLVEPSIDGGGGVYPLEAATRDTTPQGAYTPGADTCANLIVCAASAKMWLSDVSVASGTDPQCCPFTCDTNHANWTLAVFPQYATKALFCADYPGELARHIVYDAGGANEIDVWTLASGMVMTTWSYSRSWTDTDCDPDASCEASTQGFGSGLTDPVLITVESPYCMYQVTCNPPALDTNATELCT